MFWENLRNLVGKVIKIITLNTFQMVMVRIYDPPYSRGAEAGKNTTS